MIDGFAVALVVTAHVRINRETCARSVHEVPSPRARADVLCTKVRDFLCDSAAPVVEPPGTATELPATAAYVREELSRWLYFGESCDERMLAVVAAEVPRDVPTLRPITCWPLDWKDIQTYIAWRSTRKFR